MDGDDNGDERVPAVHASIQSPSPQKCSAKSKGRAVEGWRRGKEGEAGGNSEFVLFSSSPHVSPFFYSLIHDGRSFFIFRNTKCLEITNQQHLYTPVARLSPTSKGIFQLQELSRLRSYSLQTL